jgi:hypothetical protein
MAIARVRFGISTEVGEDEGNVKNNLIRLGTVVVMGLLVFAAACGGDDGDDGGDGTPASQPTSASTAPAATTVAGDPTDEPDDDAGSSGQQQFSEMSPQSQDAVNTLCMIAADPATGLAQAVNIEITLQAAQAGQYGPDIADVAGPFNDAYAGTDPAAFDAAVADMKAVCDDIGWTAQ